MSARVLFQDLGGLHRAIAPTLMEAVDRVVKSGWYILGTEVEQFEDAFARYCEAQNCVSVASGLDALKLALMAIRVGPGDEVIVPSHAYQATWLAAISVGATPVPVEPAEGSYLIDPDGIRAAITSRTRAIIPIHLYGEPCDMTAICTIATLAGLAVIEDAAQAHGALWRGKKIGAHGDVTCWSFYPTKNLGALGDGGAVTTDDPQVAERIRSLRNYGMGSERTVLEPGLNSRLDELQAAILRVKLQHLDDWNSRRQASATAYQEYLTTTEVSLPRTRPEATPVWHQYVVRLGMRDAIKSRLADTGIQTAIHYPVPVASQPAFESLGFHDEQFPRASSLSKEILSLPIAPGLAATDLEKVAAVLKTAVAEYS